VNGYLERFTTVEIGDSTTITVPDDYAGEFPDTPRRSRQARACFKRS
jgi:hypothetical protein